MKSSANLWSGIRIATSRMGSTSKRDGKIRGIISLGTTSSTSRATSWESRSSTIRVISGQTSRRMDDQTNTSTGTRTARGTNTCSQSQACSSSGPSRKVQVYMALRMLHTSTWHQSTILERISSKTRQALVTVKSGSQRHSSPNSRLNLPHSFLSHPLRTAASRRLSSQGRAAWPLTPFRPTKRPKTPILS